MRERRKKIEGFTGSERDSIGSVWGGQHDEGETHYRSAGERLHSWLVRNAQTGAAKVDEQWSRFERVNLRLRHFARRFGRLGLAWSRKLDNHRAPVSLFVAAHDPRKVHSTLACSPAVGAKLATETWTIERLIEEVTRQSHTTESSFCRSLLATERISPTLGRR